MVPTVTLGPSGDPALLARVDLAPASTTASELYRAIPLRHTDRSAFQFDRRLPADVVGGLDALADQTDVRIHWLLGPAERAAFSTLTVAATEASIADAQQSHDDNAWYRSTSTEIQTHATASPPTPAGCRCCCVAWGS